ncbi:MAG: aromatic amino acid transport family protein [Enterobacteriaceae bacterium]|nr:aromatic amino acid transport family protein [Enterobacteriaceae bacterium]
MHLNKIISSILLISCTSIGGGILALPCATVQNGFFLSNILFIICWIFMTISSLFMLEVTLWFKKNTNIITMVDQILGFKWKIFISIIYILLLYSLISAYIYAYDNWLKKILIEKVNIINIQYICAIFFIILSLKITFYKAISIDKVNYHLSLALLIIYTILIIMCIPKININSLKTFETNNISKNISLIITSFGFCIIIPTLATHLKKNIRNLFYSIIIGSIIPLVVYIIWQMAILGIFPKDGKFSLLKLKDTEANFDIMFIYFIENILNTTTMSNLILLFSILSILTSTIGVMLGLNDILSDSLNIKKNKTYNKIALTIITTIPPIIFATYFAIGFTLILKFSGILVSILLGIIPSIMVWQGRYKLKIKSKFILIGGKTLLALTLLFFIYVIIQETYILIIV